MLLHTHDLCRILVDCPSKSSVSEKSWEVFQFKLIYLYLAQSQLNWNAPIYDETEASLISWKVKRGKLDEKTT